jgi:DNA-binding IclR family transcriptional regulator
MDKLAPDAALKHRIPAIDRMMEVLGQLERHSEGVSIRDLVAQLKLPRTTIYRILNSLQSHSMVRRDEHGGYHLGRRLLGLAAHVAASASRTDILTAATPVLEALSAELGEGSKLSVVDDDGVLVLAAAQGGRPYALSVAPGQRMPLHGGAASKLLLAYQDESAIDLYLSRPLAGYTPRTITDPKRLRSELTRIRRLGWSQDKGESVPSILAFAAPVFYGDDSLAAALSVPFLLGTEPSRMEEIRLATIAGGRKITAALQDAG